MRMIDILPSHVREWVADRVKAGVSPATIRHNKIVLSAIFTTTLNDQVTLIHPCRGVRTPTVAVKGYRIITPDQFEHIYGAIPDGQLKLLVELPATGLVMTGGDAFLGVPLPRVAIAPTTSRMPSSPAEAPARLRRQDAATGRWVSASETSRSAPHGEAQPLRSLCATSAGAARRC